LNRPSTDEVIADLNRLFAEEVEAAIRDLHLRNAVRGLERLTVDPILKEGLAETIQHAEIIARKIRSLGRVPKLEIQVTCSDEALSGQEAIRQALTVEEAALEAYHDVLGHVEGDVSLEEFVRAQIAIESEHVAELRELLA
jgi:bacterioferritin (cytochrome b1)